jgi:hypothetical protein
MERAALVFERYDAERPAPFRPPYAPRAQFSVIEFGRRSDAHVAPSTACHGLLCISTPTLAQGDGPPCCEMGMTNVGGTSPALKALLAKS